MTDKPDLYFDSEEKAVLVKDFFEGLIHVKGEWAGQTFKIEPWQWDDILCPAFCELRKCGADCQGDDCSNFHPRRYRIVYVEIPRKNGKSFLTSGCGLYCLTMDDEPGGEVYAAAADVKQANIVFGTSKKMLLAHEDLPKVTTPWSKSIEFDQNGSTYSAISSDAPSKHGYNPSCILFDELHVQPNPELYETLHTGIGTRRQPVEWLITTAGHDKTSLCWSFHHKATQVRDGIIDDDSFLGVIYAADEEDDWTDPEVWAKANPNLGVSVKMEYLVAECKKAQEQPEYENTFKRLHLNLWTEQNVRWLQMSAWDLCDQPILREGPCAAGLDLASTTDVAALAFYWPETNSVELHCFVPEQGAAKRAREDGVPYPTWANQGLLTLTDGNVTDYGVIRRVINEKGREYGVGHVFADPWNFSHLSNELNDDGFETVRVPQSVTEMSAPSKRLSSLVTSNRLRHGGNPVLRWMASNVAVRVDSETNIKPNKEKSGEKIDGIVATILAIKGASSLPVPGKYDNGGGILVLG